MFGSFYKKRCILNSVTHFGIHSIPFCVLPYLSQIDKPGRSLCNIWSVNAWATSYFDYPEMATLAQAILKLDRVDRNTVMQWQKDVITLRSSRGFCTAADSTQNVRKLFFPRGQQLIQPLHCDNQETAPVSVKQDCPVEDDKENDVDRKMESASKV